MAMESVFPSPMYHFFPRLNILHCGGNQELEFIRYLSNVITTSERDVPFTLDYTDFQEQQDKKEIVYHDAEKYKNNGMPILILLSKSFFDLMWNSSRKKDLLEILSSETIKGCLHVWLDVNETDVKGYCNKFLREDDNFKRIKYADLKNSPEIVKTIRRLLHESSDSQNNNPDNYGIDDEADDMRRRFLESNPQYAGEEPTAAPNPSHPNQQPSKKKKKKKGNVYSDALRIASMNDEELEQYRRGGGGGGGGMAT